MTSTEQQEFLQEFYDLMGDYYLYEMEHTYSINGELQRFKMELVAQDDQDAQIETTDFMNEFFSDPLVRFISSEILVNNTPRYKIIKPINQWRKV